MALPPMVCLPILTNALKKPGRLLAVSFYLDLTTLISRLEKTELRATAKLGRSRPHSYRSNTGHVRFVATEANCFRQ